jgi:hypothetical protein
MGFFIFDDVGRLTTSKTVWIYPAVVIPLTVTTFVIWLAWIKLRPNKVQDEVQKLGLSIKRRETLQAEAEKGGL